MTDQNSNKGVAIQTAFIHGGSFIRIADDLFSTSHWPLVQVEIGDEISLFTKSTAADSFFVGTVVAIVEHEGYSPRRFTFIFRAKPGICVSRSVIANRNDHYYEIREDIYVR